MFVTNWISTTKIQKISEITNFFRHYFLSRTEVIFTPLMSVPEAPVHQNTGAIFPQHDVRLARQPRMIEPIPESPTPQKFPDKNLRFGIPAPYCRHIVMALFYGQTVRHL